MPRGYRHIQDYEKEILKLRMQGKTRREICEKFGFSIKQMENFIRLLDFPDGGITVLTSELKRGQRVRIIHGPFKGIEGELMRIGGDRRVVVRLEGVVSIATPFINPAFLEKIE